MYESTLQSVRAIENARIQQCNPALLSHYKKDAEHKGAIVITHSHTQYLYYRSRR